MTEPHWTSYVGMATGIIGAITGVSGAIMGYVSYRRSNRLKSLDLRLELRKAVNELQSNFSQIEKLIEYANQSRVAVAAARGFFHSGMMEKWKQDVEADKIIVRKLGQKAPSVNMDYYDLTPQELESKLVEVHRLQVQLNELRKKYDAAVLADEEERKYLREDARARFPSKQ
jgi:hypothetical protein